MNQTHPESEIPPVQCPVCSSRQVAPVRKNFDGGLGCLGLILFGWVGLLLGLLGGSDIEMYCQNCGYRWSPQGRGCFPACGTIAAVILILLLTFMLFFALFA